jgi:hypothetical protein
MANLFGRGQPGWLGAVCPIAVYLKHTSEESPCQMNNLQL